MYGRAQAFRLAGLLIMLSCLSPLNLFGASTPALSGLSCASTTNLVGWVIDACKVTLSAAAPSSGLTVSLSSNNSNVTVPSATTGSVTVPSGATSAAFQADVNWWNQSSQTVAVTASAGGVSKSLSLSLIPATRILTISPTSVAFGSVSLNTILTKTIILKNSGNLPLTVNAPTVTGAGFSVSVTGYPVTLNAGQSADLALHFDPTTAGAVTGQLSVTANDNTGGNTKTVALSGTGAGSTTAALSAFSCGSSSMTGAGTDTCTVTLSSATTSSMTVSLASSNAAVTVPATVTVPANASSASFSATVKSVTSATSVTLSASTSTVSKSVALTLNATGSPALSINASSIAFGNVTVNTPATQSLTLTSTGGTAVTVNSATITGAGFTVSGGTFPATLSPGTTLTLEVQFDPTVAGASTGSLTIASTSSTGSSAAVSLSGTGEAMAYEVNLSWTAPTSSSDPIAGYNVYRAPTGSSTYELLNSSVDSQTTYVDSTVQTGATYQYYVESVDDSGVESSPSAAIAVTIS